MTILMIVPAISHPIEYLVQSTFSYSTGTLGYTGEAGSQPLVRDVRRFPAPMLQFAAFAPGAIAALFRRKEIGSALWSLAGCGAIAQIIGWGITNKPASTAWC